MEHINLQDLFEYSRATRVVRKFSGPIGSMSSWYVLKQDRRFNPTQNHTR